MLWIPFALMLVGLVGVVAGVRRRREGQGPCCAGCEYDLVGIVGDDGAAARCPECGSELEASGAVVTGVRTERGRMAKATALIGLVMLITGASLGGYQAQRWSRSYDWDKIKPVWLLHAQAKKSTATSGVGVLDELIARLESDRLSATDAAPIIETLLTKQANLAAPWNQQWGDLMSAAFSGDIVTSEQTQRYVAGVVVLESKSRPWIYPGEPVPIRCSIKELRCGTLERFHAKVTLQSARLAGKNLSYDRYSAPFGIALGGWSAPALTWWTMLGGFNDEPYQLRSSLLGARRPEDAASVAAPRQLGPATLQVVWRLEIERQGEEGDDIAEPVTLISHQENALDVEIARPGTHPLTPRLDNGGLVVSIDEIRLERTAGEDVYAHGVLLIDANDLSNGYDIVWRFAPDTAAAMGFEREWVVASCIIPRRVAGTDPIVQYTSAKINLPAMVLAGSAIEGVEVVLRPNAAITRMTIDGREIPTRSTSAGIHRVPIVDQRRP